jgi:deazaflavin-dependent oxidoreductase (nitroreductase family)
MLRRSFKFVGALALVLSAWFAFIVVAMRTKSPRLLGVVRRFNRSFTNKLQRRSAGTPGAYASVIRHRGRRSGREYETPVVPFATDGGFVIVLPYGPDTDWVKNVLSAGSAVLVTGGATHDLDCPEVVALEAVYDAFPANEQRTHRLFNVTQCLQLRRVDQAGVVTTSDR